MTPPPPPSSLTQEERTALSDARMADAAVSLICERGAAATTLKEVGLRAGYSRGLASVRFGSKAALWTFLVRTIGEEWLQELDAATAGTVGVATIDAAIDAHCRFLLDASDRIRAFYILWFDQVTTDDALRRVISDVHARRQRSVQRWITAGIADGLIKPDVDVRAVAVQFRATMIGIVYMWLVVPLPGDEVRRLHADVKARLRSLLAGDVAADRSTPPS